MGRSKRLEIIFHNGEPEGIRIYMRHLSTIKAYLQQRVGVVFFYPLLKNTKRRIIE